MKDRIQATRRGNMTDYERKKYNYRIEAMEEMIDECTQEIATKDNHIRLLTILLSISLMITALLIFGVVSQ